GAAGPAQPQPSTPDRGRAADHVRSPAESLSAGRGRGEGVFRESGLPHTDPSKRASRRGAELRSAHRSLRRHLLGRAELPLPGPRARPAREEERGRRCARGSREPTCRRRIIERSSAPMANKRDRLGKGLGALLGEYLVEPAGDDAEVRLLSVAAITPNPFQPRREFDEQELTDLAASIKENGLLQPIVVRPAPAGSRAKWELVAGERRWRAVTRLGWTEVPAMVRPLDDRAML